MAISLSDIQEAVVDYFSSRVVTSSTVAPLSGQEHINPNEKFDITLTVKNSADDPAQGVQINNVCYHVSVVPPDALLIVPDSSVAVARKSASPDSPPLDPTVKEQTELFLFPPAPDDILGAGATGSPLRIQGSALVVGAPDLFFHVHGEVKFDALFPRQKSPTNAKQTFEIESS
jgi:hypothetical protein